MIQIPGLRLPKAVVPTLLSSFGKMFVQKYKINKEWNLRSPPDVRGVHWDGFRLKSHKIKMPTAECSGHSNSRFVRICFLIKTAVIVVQIKSCTFDVSFQNQTGSCVELPVYADEGSGVPILRSFGYLFLFKNITSFKFEGVSCRRQGSSH